MATSSAHYFEAPSSRRGRDSREPLRGRARVSEPASLPMRRNRVGVVMVAIAGALIGFGAITLATSPLDVSTLSETPFTPSRAPEYEVSEGYVQALMTVPPVYTTHEDAASSAAAEETTGTRSLEMTASPPATSIRENASPLQSLESAPALSDVPAGTDAMSAPSEPTNIEESPVPLSDNPY